jgi:protein-S-isoprenylcysteine O-methyltransferase Ste14
MNSLTAKALAGFLMKLVITGLLLFLPAWSLDFWEAYVFLLTFFVPQLLIIIYLLRKDPDLLKRRLKGGSRAENRTSQKIIMLLVSLCFVLLVLVPGLDHRFNWSHVPALLVIAADVAVLLGFLTQFHAFKENSFASAVVAIVPEQKVISTGPYAVVRHPMYSGSLLVNFFISIALGSWWGLPFALAMLAVIILRLLDEETFLAKELPGYSEYRNTVRYRLVPLIW